MHNVVNIYLNDGGNNHQKMENLINKKSAKFWLMYISDGVIQIVFLDKLHQKLLIDQIQKFETFQK